jgi:glycosyltransferase involved in cell wall biosynthesis
VTVYTTNIDGLSDLDVPVNQPVNIDGVIVYYFKGSKNPILRAWFYSKELRRALAENTKNFDIIHSTGVFLMAATLGAYYARKFKKPFVLSPRGSLMREPLKKRSSLKKKIYISLIERRNLKNASAIHFTSDMEKEEYLRAGLPLKKAIVIPNGLDVQEFQLKPEKGLFRKKFNISADKKIILFLSRLSWKKGFDTLIPAFAKVIKKEPKAVLVIAGGDDENYKKEIEKMISEINIRTSDVLKLKPSIFGTSDVQKIKNSNIIFTDMLLGDDKAAAYSESDVFVLPSYSENFGMVVVEAMACGLPVVIAKNVGIAPSVERAVAGIVVEKSVNQLTLAILKILDSPNLAKRIGENGRRMVETEFSWPEIAGAFINEYNSLIANT